MQYYTNFAYNPVTNKNSKDDQQHNNHFSRKHAGPQTDTVSWWSLQNPDHALHESNNLKYPRHEQRSADNLLNSHPSNNHKLTDLKLQQFLHEAYQRPRAQPQVPSHRKMGRRASEGSSYADRDIYRNCVLMNEPSGEMVVDDNTKVNKSITCVANAPHHTHPNMEMSNLPYHNAVGCRLSLDAGRRDSSSSLTSSLAEGSKDSLSSYDSLSTMTDRSMSRILKSMQQKENFLRSCNPADSASIQREFYGRPKKLERAMWPPTEPRQESPSRGNKPTHQHFQRVKNDIENERDYVQSYEPKHDTFNRIDNSGTNHRMSLRETVTPIMSVEDRQKGYSEPDMQMDNIEKR